MTRAVVHYLPREMALLGAIEMIVSFLVIAALLLVYRTSIDPTGAEPGTLTDTVGMAFVLSAVLSGAAIGAGLYHPAVYRDSRRLMVGGCATLTMAGVLVAMGSRVVWPPNAGHVVTGIALLAAGGCGAIPIRLAHATVIGRRPLTRRILLAGSADDVRALQRQIAVIGADFEPVILPDCEWSWDILRQRRIWAIVAGSDVLGGVPADLLDCKLRGMRVLSTVQFREAFLGRLELDTLAQADLLTADGFHAQWTGLAIKRVSDIVLAIVLLLATLPLMVIAAVAVKLESRGPVLYTQQRIGQFGKPFTLFKFRSMAVNAEAGGTPRWAQKHDPRITRVGRFIRTTRIDELPQLVNVLRGEMSLVGPRPERPHFVEQLARAIPFYQQRSYAKPGLTGWAQVNFPYGASVEDAREKLSYDLYYVKNRSLKLDLFILFATIRVVLRGEGAR